MTYLSVNINKIATIRNARGGVLPSVTDAAIKCQEFGAHGITIHPRPDERHITKLDVYDLKKVVHTEFNIEGNPTRDFIDLVLKTKPEQVTLVPDAIDAITSNAGWNTQKNISFLTEVITEFKNNQIRTSIFLDPDTAMIESAAKTGTDRIELYTEAFAHQYSLGNKNGILPYKETAKVALEHQLELNAGHDLSLENIAFFINEIPEIKEVSIGHALISEALYLGLEQTIHNYLIHLQQ